MSQFLVKYGRSSNRRMDENNFLHITDCVLTAEEVSDYLGKEIAGWDKLGLDPEKPYGVYRPKEEIEKAAPTFNGLPLMDKHIPISSTKPEQKEWIGCVGTNSRVEDGQLLNIVSIWKDHAIQDIKKADATRGEQGKKDLSCGYGYDLVKEDGQFNGRFYHFKMVNLRGNHVALVEDGRVEGAMIADNNTLLKDKPKVKNTVNAAFQALLKWSNFAGDAKGKKRMMDKEAMKKCIAEIEGKADDEFAGGAHEKMSHMIDIYKKMHDESEETKEEKEEHKQMKKNEEDDDAMDRKKLRIKKGRKAQDEDDDMMDEEEGEKEKVEKELKEKDKKRKAEDENEEGRESEAEKRKDIAKEKREAADSSYIAKVVNDAIRMDRKVVALCTKAIGKINPQILMDSSPDELIDKTLKIKGLESDGKSLEAKIAMIEAITSQMPVKPSAMAMDKKVIATKSEFVNPLSKNKKGAK